MAQGEVMVNLHCTPTHFKQDTYQVMVGISKGDKSMLRTKYDAATSLPGWSHNTSHLRQAYKN